MEPTLCRLTVDLETKRLTKYILQWFAQGGSGCSLSEDVQGQIGRGLERAGLVGGIPTRGRGVGTA